LKFITVNEFTTVRFTEADNEWEIKGPYSVPKDSIHYDNRTSVY